MGLYVLLDLADWFLSQIMKFFSYYLLTGGWRWTLTPWWTRLCLGACQDRTVGPLVFRKPVSWWVWLLSPQLVVWLEASQHWSLQVVGGAKSWCRWANMAATRSVHMVECSLLCLPPVSVSPGWATASRLLPLQETFQDQQVDVAQAPIKLLLFLWVLAWVKFCVWHFRLSLYLPKFCGIPETMPCWPSKLDALGLIFLVLESCVQEPEVGLRTLAPAGEPLQDDLFSSLRVPSLRVYGIWWYCDFARPTNLLVIPSLCL